VAGRRAAIAAYFRNASDAVSAATATLLSEIAAARPGARLVVVGCDAVVARALASTWGYDVDAVEFDVRGRLCAPTGAAAVVVCGQPVERRRLRDINRVLAPGGAVYFVGAAGHECLDAADLESLLDDAGLSRATTRDLAAVVAHKCGVPARQPSVGVGACR
jgi:hypothetical protein